MKDNIRKQHQIIRLSFLLIILFFPALNLYPATLTECLMESIQYADNSVTVGQLRKQCQEETETISRDIPQESSLSEISTNGPIEMVLKTAREKKPAYFPHQKHQKKYSCGMCHHGRDASGRLVKYTENTIINKCTSCHNLDMTNKELNGFQLIGHKLCRECHRKNQNITSAKCSTCHRKNL